MGKPLTFALSAYFNVLMVWLYWSAPQETFATMHVREFPLKLSFNKRVNLLFRNGTYPTFFPEVSLLFAAPFAALLKSPLVELVLFVYFFPSALIQFASASRDLLMLAPSLSLFPKFRVSLARSLPARSTKLSLPLKTGEDGSPPPKAFRSTLISNTACDRDETEFASVGSTFRRAFPMLRRCMISSRSLTFTFFSPKTTQPFWFPPLCIPPPPGAVPPPGPSRSSSGGDPSGMSKSKINSLYTSRYEQVTSNLNSPLCRLTPEITEKKGSVASRRVWVYCIGRVLDDVWTTVTVICLNIHQLRDRTVHLRCIPYLHLMTAVDVTEGRQKQCAWIWETQHVPSNTSFKLSTIIPGSAALPTMVCVLPLPVAPYANTVPLCPDNTPGINSLAVLS